MTSIIGSLTMGKEYAPVPPGSPEADARFIQDISFESCAVGASDESFKHRTSFSNTDFDGSVGKDGSLRSSTWQDTAIAVGQWTTSAAATMSDTIVNGARYVQTLSGQKPQAPIRLSPSPSPNKKRIRLDRRDTAPSASSFSSSGSHTIATHNKRRTFYDGPFDGAAADTYDDHKFVPAERQLDRVARDQVRRRQHDDKLCGRGIDRDYLHHNTLQSASGVAGYLGDMLDRFTSAKMQPDKAKWQS